MITISIPCYRPVKPTFLYKLEDNINNKHTCSQLHLTNLMHCAFVMQYGYYSFGGCLVLNLKFDFFMILP